MELTKKKISSYGMFSADTYVASPKSYQEVIDCIDLAKSKEWKICPAGSMLSFSNVCIVTNQLSLNISKLNQIISIDTESQSITVQAGIRTTTILAHIMPLGFTLNSLTGSLGNTVAGEIANDVNGKDSWKNGNFGANVISFKLATADSEIKHYSRIDDEEIYNALIAGLGLLGVIVEVTLKLSKIPSYTLTTQSFKIDGIDQLVEKMNNLDEKKTEFAYCWTDPFSPALYLGRGIIETATFVEKYAPSSHHNLLEGFIQKEKIGPFSPELFWSIFKKFDSPLSFKLASKIKFALAKNSSKDLLFTQYQYPMLKYFPKWNLKYKPHGFREWQILFPAPIFAEAYKTILLLCQKNNFTPYICAVRKHIPQSPYLSFAGDGFSMTVNYGVGDHSPSSRVVFEQTLLEKIVLLQGKVYLGKYPFISKPVLTKMYPQFEDYLKVKHQLDKNLLFWSDAAEHLFAD